MAATKYTYSISTDFPNHKVASDRLLKEIRESAIVTAVDYVAVSEDDCDIWFKDQLSLGDKTILDGLVAVHSGEPLPDRQMSLQTDGSVEVAVVGREGFEFIAVTHDFCDETTWYTGSVRANAEVLIDSGDGKLFTSLHALWIDMYHGNVYDEAIIRETVLHKYATVVTVDDVEKTARKPFAPSGGDYTIDYKTGKITFADSQAGKTVKASYSYATDNTGALVAPEGMCMEMQYSEIQFSMDFDMKGAIVLTYWIEDTPIGETRYDTVKQVVYEAKGNMPLVKACGGTSRGLSQDMQVFPMTYQSVKRIFNDPLLAERLGGCTKMTFKITDHDDESVVCEGLAATATFYGVWRKESDLRG